LPVNRCPVLRSEHTNDFFYGVTNVNVDLLGAPGTGSVAVHWPVSQGTYLRNMNLTVGKGLTGIFGEAGSGGLISDVAISGGDYGMQFGNQQWTFRDVVISGARKAGIQILWNWVFTFVGLAISDCKVG
jgi:glucan 1,3-beta-glucosidase